MRGKALRQLAGEQIGEAGSAHTRVTAGPWDVRAAMLKFKDLPRPAGIFGFLMLQSLFKKIFGSRNDRLVKQYLQKVKAINALEPAMEKLSAAELRGKTAEFRSRLEGGESLDKLLPEAFAVVREASKRVLGPNGAGKTTLLNTLSGLLPAQAGTVSVGGRTIRNGRPADASDAGIVLVPDDRALFTSLTVEENLLAARGAHR